MNPKIRDLVVVVAFSIVALLGGILLADSLAYVSKSPPKDAFVLISSSGGATPFIHWNLDMKELILGAVVCVAGCIAALLTVKSRLRLIPIGVVVLFVALGLFGTIETRRPFWFTANTELLVIGRKGEFQSTDTMRTRYIRKQDLENQTLFQMPGEIMLMVGVKAQWSDR